MTKRIDWLSQAACGDRDPAIYTTDPAPGGNRYTVGAKASTRIRFAREACRGCPVAAECARDALDDEAGGTIRGGIYIPEAWHRQRGERPLATLALGLIAGGTITADDLEIDTAAGVVRWGGRGAQRLTQLVLATYGNVCHLCGGRGATTADHVIPRSHGGDNSLENMRPAHARCNSQRGNMSIEQWRERFGARSRHSSRDW